MKNTLAIIVGLIYCTAFAQVPVQTTNQTISKDPKAQIKFETMTLDFGKIKKDVPVTKNFTFTNTGNTPLIITSTHAGCGCTTPTALKIPYSQDRPVLLGQGLTPEV